MAGRNREFDETVALQKAAEVFRLKGYESASTEELLSAMDLNKGSMYNAFGNKRDLFVRVFDAFSENFLNCMKNIFRNNPDTKKTITQIFMDVARSSDRDEHNRGCFYSNTLAEMSGVDDELAKLAQDKLKEVEKLFAAEIKTGIKSGHIKAGISPVETARYLVNFWSGLSITRRLYSRKELEQLVTINLKVLE